MLCVFVLSLNNNFILNYNINLFRMAVIAVKPILLRLRHGFPKGMISSPALRRTSFFVSRSVGSSARSLVGWILSEKVRKTDFFSCPRCALRVGSPRGMIVTKPWAKWVPPLMTAAPVGAPGACRSWSCRGCQGGVWRGPKNASVGGLDGATNSY